MRLPVELSLHKYTPTVAKLYTPQVVFLFRWIRAGGENVGAHLVCHQCHHVTTGFYRSPRATSPVMTPSSPYAYPFKW